MSDLHTIALAALTVLAFGGLIVAVWTAISVGLMRDQLDRVDDEHHDLWKRMEAAEDGVRAVEAHLAGEEPESTGRHAHRDPAHIVTDLDGGKLTGGVMVLHTTMPADPAEVRS